MSARGGRGSARWGSFLLAGLISAVGLAGARAYDFTLGDVTMSLQEVTTNLDVYFRAMRYNRAANEWDVDVTVSNKSSVTIQAPLVYLVDSFTGTSGPLSPDGVSTNLAFYDLSGQIPSGILAPGATTGVRTLALGFTTNGAPKLVAQLFAGVQTNSSQALAFVRTLNQAGQPLPGVSVQENGPSGAATNLTDSVFGVATLGELAGNYVWQFSQAGYLSVWRQAALQSNAVTVLPYPWLAAANPQAVAISPLLGGTVSNQTVAVQFGAGGVSQPANVQLTELSSQTLPLFLPQGWSPLQAFWLQSSFPFQHPVSASLVPWGPIGNGESAVLVQFSSSPLGWQVLQLVQGDGTNAVTVSLPAAGTYALVVADAGPAPPPAGLIGSALLPGNAPFVDPTNLQAFGTVTPSASPASLVPSLVTATADLVVTNLTGGGLPSGTLLKGHVGESYLLNDGTTRVPPFYGNSIMAFQRPGQPQFGIVHATFPMSPLLLFGAAQLTEGNVRADLLPPGPFTGGVLGTNGGAVANAGLRLLVAPGVLAGPEAVQLFPVSPTNFASVAGTSLPVVAAFEVAVGSLPAGSQLYLQATGVPPSTTLVLARVLTDQGLYGLEPRIRLQSDVNGNLLSAEPTNSDRLTGLTGSGEYVLLQAQPQQDLVEGVAQNAAGQPTGGLPVQVAGQPWLTFSAPDGSFKLLAPGGAGTLSVSDPATGDAGAQAIAVPTNLTPLTATVAVVARGLQVASISPADGATNISQVSSVVINFNRPLNPATLLTNGVQLLESNVPVATTFSLNLANTTLTLLPGGSLDPGVQFSVVLATNITDAIGRPLQGQTQFAFTTAALSARDPAAQLIIYAPGATNLDTNVLAQLPGYVPGTNASQIVVHGTPGCSDPGVPVVVVDEASGASTTVLSQPDGSFTTFVNGQEQDFISATFISLNGARLYVPVNRQLFDDGSVGLYQSGGALQATGDGGAVQITVPANAVASRAVFKLNSVTAPELETQLGGIMPSNGVVAGSALNLNIRGSVPTLPLQVSFPVDLSQLGYPTNAPGTNAAAVLAVVQTNQSLTTFQVMDQLLFVPQSSASSQVTGKASSSPALKGRRGPVAHRPEGGPNGGSLAGALDTSVGLLVSSLGPAGFLASVGFNQVLVPLLFGSRPVTIKGKVTALPYEIAQQLELAGLINNIYNLQLGSVGTLNGNPILNVPIQLAQTMGLAPANVLAPISGNAANVVGAVLALSASALQIAADNLAAPLGGAFVTVSQVGGGLVNVPGQLYPGMVYATSDSTGSFLTVVPAAGFNYITTCTHPLYAQILQKPLTPINPLPGQQGQLSLAGVVFQSFYFMLPATNSVPPSVQIGNSPVQPAAGQQCQLVINASMPTGSPGIKILLVAGTTDLLTGQPAINPQITQSTPVVTQPTPTSTQWTCNISVDEPVVVTVRALVYNPNGVNGANYSSAAIPYQIAFTGPTQPTQSPTIPPPDANDKQGPLVMEVDPPNNGFLGADSQITVVFNKPIDSSVANRPSGIILNPVGISLPSPPLPIVGLSPNQQTLSLQYPGLPPSTTFQLILTAQSIQDLAGQPLNQQPSVTPPVNFTTTFRTPPAATASFSPPLVNGRGAVISGTELYAIDQAPQGNFLDSFSITAPLQPTLQNQLRLPGAPRDIVVIPQFIYKRNAQDTLQTNDLVVVVGGDLGAQQTSFGGAQGPAVSVPGQYLWVVNMGNPSSPVNLASPYVSFRVGSAVTKVRWAPPYLVYEEYGSDIQLLGLVNLQEMIFGFGSSLVQQYAFGNGRPGSTTNTDGSYWSPGDVAPIPPTHPPEFYGLDFGYVLEGSTQGILDFSATPRGKTVGVTLTDGVLLDTNGNPTGPATPFMYRTLVSSGLPLNIENPTDASFPFPGAYPRWVTCFDVLQLPINGVLTTISAALVSLEPDSDGVQKLALLDISLPETPTLVNKIALPSNLLGGNIESVSVRPDGLLAVAGQQNLVIVDPTKLGITIFPAGQLPPCIVDVIQGAGGITRSLGSSPGGVYAVADTGRGSIVMAPPQAQFISFPTSDGLVDPAGLNQLSDAQVQQVFAGQNLLSALAPANIDTALGLTSDLEPPSGPPNPALHYYVLLYAPGGGLTANAQIDLGLESLNPSGLPLSNLGVGFAPVRAVSVPTQQAIGQTPRPCGAPIRALPAYRVSNNPNSVYYNWYLSRPFALITDAVSTTDLARMQGDGGVEREILFSGYWLRAFIDPDQSTNAALAPFAAQTDVKAETIYPIAPIVAPTANRSYLVGGNPPPPGVPVPMEDSYGTVLAHSGELRTSDPDLILPSPRMPIEIIRAIGNQDTYEGSFGVGWDFNYNQRLTVLDPLTFPEGLQMPLVVRDNLADSEVAGSQDVLFHSGSGITYHYTWAGNTMPAQYTQDPLVQAFDYQDVVSDYYLPQRGFFDLLVRFKDGRFERLTSSGARYRYRSDGRLEHIIDRYPANTHNLTYDPYDLDKLVRIDDYSVPGPRYVQFGYYRIQGVDPTFTAGLDINTSDAYLVGKICRLRDYTGRDVLFNYTSDGFLTNRQGVVVDGENGGFAGRCQTYYYYTDCRLTEIASTVNGTPLIATVNTMSPAGTPVANSSTGSRGNNQYSIPANNSAATVGGQTSSVSLADGTTQQHQFDKWGNVIATTVSGPSGAPATAQFLNNDDGLESFVQYPEGNTETLTYDSGNPVLRSRANLKTVQVDPGPRGGPAYTLTFNYDPRNNLPSGDQTDANGFTITYTLTADGNDVASVAYGNAGTKTFTYNANGQVTSILDPSGFEHDVDYDPNTGFISTENRGDITYTYTYDDSIPSQLGSAASVAPPLGEPTTYLYNNLQQPVEMDRGDSVALTAYDEVGRGTFHEEQVGDGKEWMAQIAYDDKGFITNTVMNGIEVNGQVNSISYNYTPDARMRVQSILFPDGAVENLQYDNRGNVSQETIGDYTAQYTYDLNNNVISVNQGGDVVSTLEYDGLNRATNTFLNTGTQTYTLSSAFFPGGELAASTVNDPQFGILRQQTTDQIDALGRPLQVTVHGGVISPQYQYAYSPLSATVTGPFMTATRTWDTSGNQIGYSDPDLTAVFQRDANGRIQEKDSQELGNTTYSKFFTYNELDWVTNTGDLSGTVFSALPRADGNEISITDGNGNTTTYDHSALGEPLLRTRADGMQVITRYDGQRRVVYKGDPGAGFNYAFDSTLRLTNSTLRNGASIAYTQFDPRSMPTTMAIPGGTETLAYDLQRQVIQRKVSYQGTTWEEEYTYDALGRVRSETYTQNGGAPNTATFDFDPAGPLLAAHFTEDNATFNVAYGYYADGTRKTITYPSGVTVTEVRDSTGLLTGLTDPNGNVISALTWQGNFQPQKIQLGKGMQVVNTYDSRGRPTGERVTRSSDNSVLAHLRYQYDGANNVQVRQFVHRNGQADQFFYDPGERLDRAQIGTVPLSKTQFATPLYDLFYGYDANGLDYLTSTTFVTNLTASLPIFATNWTSHDNFLLPSFVDGFNRGQADPMGNVTEAMLWVRPLGAAIPEAVPAALQHDGLGRLVSVTRPDGVAVENEFQPGGLRFSRKVSQQGQLLSYSAFVYDSSGRLLEEYDRTGATPALIGRYYYASGDAPAAADLLDPASGQLERYFFLRDASQSVVAVADTNGMVLERVWYDAFGQPNIEERDTTPPVLQTVIDGGGGSLLIAFSEPVWAPTNDPGPGGGIVPFPPPPTNALTVSVLGANIQGTVQWLPGLAGFAPYSVVRFTPTQPLPGVPPAGFVAWWPASGTTLDVQGGDTAALEGGAGYGPGLIGQAFALNGTGAFVEVPDSPALNFGTNDFTASLWVNFKSTGGEQVLIEKWLGSPATGWSLIKMPDSSLRLALGTPGGEVDINSGPLGIPATNWLHYAVRRQSNQFTIFTNGVPVASGTNTANLNAATPLLFGSRSGTSLFLNGSIDEITLYSRALSAAELTSIAEGVSDPGPVTITLNAATVSDEWANTNVEETISFQVYNETGLVYFVAEPLPQTVPVPLARSSVGSPFLFQGQYFDYDTGLLYLRSRFYDPYSGMFFEPDPLGYEDSVNHYAGLANNPASLRDPTGLATTAPEGGFYERVPVSRSTEEPETHPFSESVVAVSRAHHEELAKTGLADTFIPAIIGAMARRLPADKAGKFAFAFKTINAPELVREYSAQNFPTKIVRIYDKTEQGLVLFEGRLYTGDVDGLSLRADDEFLKFSQVQEFQEDANKLAVLLGHIETARRQELGQPLHSTDPSFPFNHGMTGHSQEELAYLPAADAAKEFHAINTKVKDMPEGWEITVEGTQANFSLNLRRVDANESVKIFSAAAETFQARRTEGSGKFDPELHAQVQKQIAEGGEGEHLRSFPIVLPGY